MRGEGGTFASEEASLQRTELHGLQTTKAPSFQPAVEGTHSAAPRSTAPRDPTNPVTKLREKQLQENAR